MARIPKPIEYTSIDDLSGGEVAGEDLQTVMFSIGTKAYEIDLSSENAQKLVELLEPYVDAARPVSRSRLARKHARAAGNGHRDLDAVRVWARKNGHTVSDKGRIPNDILSAYNDAH
ncbi:histone-like nucleoid-structuring protein Lsr2 [Microbacterium galbinum]|uniref:Lsr2 family protein n=1 Tax=Microbacterium galbinum TaxID=2851646 RepID=A0ABY4ISU3_9MICO|nr:histone-like nucleoid-structuring protein Lsr2 [Microbacterium galbinum]UPL15699.1 Lsr2 family protein [Microbacterium galbinum]